MHLECLSMKNFRNYYTLNLTFSPRVNIFFGQNAQGKTNLLEAISILCFGKSFRTKKDEELIKWEQEACYIQGHFETGEFPIEIEIGIGTKEKRFKLDGQIVKNQVVFGKIPVITFSPDDLQIIKGSPQFRRDFIDLYLALIDPKYRFIYYNYAKVLQQRNRLLKEGIVDQNELDAWNEQLILKGSKVIKYRLLLIKNVKPFINQAQQLISGLMEQLSLDYLSFNGVILSDEQEDIIQQQYREALNQIKRIEIERHITLIGPHRDDLRLTIDKQIDLRTFGSQGQQRTAALALKLGLIEKVKEIRGQYPILLLDDVMSEFDDNRKKHLLQVLTSSAQTFMTSTSKRDFPIKASEVNFFEVIGGEVRGG